MKKWIQSLIIIAASSLVLNVSWADQEQCNPEREVCQEGGEVPFPFSVPFPLQSIEGKWQSYDNQTSYEVSVVHEGSDGFDIFLVLELDSKGDVLSRGYAAERSDSSLPLVVWMTDETGTKWVVTATVKSKDKEGSELQLSLVKSSAEGIKGEEPVLFKKM